MDMKMNPDEKDPFDEAMADDAAATKDEWAEDEGEAADAAPAVAVVIGGGEPPTPTKAEPEVATAPTPELAAEAPAAETPTADVPPDDSEYEAAAAMIKNDFGDDFFNAMSAMVKHHCRKMSQEYGGEATGSLNGRIDALIEDIGKARHFDAIRSVHDDFEQMAESPAFKTYLDGLDEAAKTEAQRIVESGTAKEAIELLNKVKAGQASTSEADDFDLDAAMGVKSSPSAPADLSGNDPDDFGDEDEWNTDTLRIRR